jgi:hypothetical protein
MENRELWVKSRKLEAIALKSKLHRRKNGLRRKGRDTSASGDWVYEG